MSDSINVRVDNAVCGRLFQNVGVWRGAASGRFPSAHQLRAGGREFGEQIAFTTTLNVQR